MTDRGLPANWDTEAAVLGGLLLNADALDEVRAILRPETFHKPSHGALFALMCGLADRGVVPDATTVLDEIEARGNATEVGGIGYVSGLPGHCAVVENVAIYARQVRGHSRRARALLRARAIAEALQNDPEADPGELFGQALDEAEGDTGTADAWRSYEEIVYPRLEQIGERARSGVKPGEPTGIAELDRLLGGFEDGCFYILAARPAMGKSTIEAQIARAFGARGLAVGRFQLEMAAEKVAEREIVAEARVDNRKVRSGDLSTDDWRQLCEGADRAASLPVFVDETPGLSIRAIRARARALKRRLARTPSGPQLRLVTIDYIQLVTTDEKGVQGEQRIATVSKQAKVMAKELGLPVFALAQLSRACEIRENKRPMMSDLRESGQLEQDADGIVFAYRDEVYTKEACTCPGVAELIVAKARDGELGTVRMAFRGPFYRFDALDDRRPAGSWAGREEERGW